MSTVDQAKIELKRKAIRFNQVFGTVEGKKVLDDLKQEFARFGSLHVPGDPYATHVRVGEAAVIEYINRMIQIATTDKEE